MTTDALSDNRLLAEIGVSEQEEQAYRLLLARGTLTVHDISKALPLTAAESERLLSSLESKGLAVCVPEPELRFLPSTPEVAIEALILSKQATLEQTRGAIALLKREGEQSSLAPRCGEGSVVEVITGRASILQAQRQLQSGSRLELRCLVPGPLIQPTSFDPIQEQTRARGVRYLSVLHSAVMTDCVAGEQVRAQAAAQDECRLAHSIPFRLMIADRQMALLPLDSHQPDRASLLVHPSSLLDGLNAMFDMIWTRATPVELATASTSAVGDCSSPFSSELEALIPFLAAGLNDKAIAHRLRISVRTLIRRVAKLLTDLNAHSRFQAGWAAALRLHGIVAPSGMHTEPSPSDSGSKGRDRNQPQHRSAQALSRSIGNEPHSRRNQVPLE